MKANSIGYKVKQDKTLNTKQHKETWPSTYSPIFAENQRARGTEWIRILPW